MTITHTQFKKDLIVMPSSLLDVSSIPLALYIHIPWCVKKCPYCDFNSHTLPNFQSASQVSSYDTAIDNADYFDVYVTAMIHDIDAQLELIGNRKITSIFIGGGTPSLLPIKQYRRLFDHLRKVLSFAEDIEITMEANPGTLEHAPFSQYLAVGINRLSIGVQSFSDQKLKALGRIHNSTQAIKAIESASQAGFQRLNIDLMHGLPNQSVDDALTDIQTAHNAGATHISWYQLTIEPNTVFYRNTPVLPDEDNLADIEDVGSTLLTQMGYKNYEVSAWVGANDVVCRHNLNYWQFGDYLAIGAGAHGKITLNSAQLMSRYMITNGINGIDSDNQHDSAIYRFNKTRLPKDYVNYTNYPKMLGFKPIPKQELSSEFMLNVLRLSEGVPSPLFSERTGLPLSEIKPTLQHLQTQGLLINDESLICPTALGRRYLNQILQAFM